MTLIFTLVNVTNNSPSRDYSHPDDQTTQTTETPGFKPFTPIYFSVSLSHRRSTQFLSKLDPLLFVIFLKFVVGLFPMKMLSSKCKANMVSSAEVFFLYLRRSAGPKGVQSHRSQDLSPPPTFPAGTPTRGGIDQREGKPLRPLRWEIESHLTQLRTNTNTGT